MLKHILLLLLATLVISFAGCKKYPRILVEEQLIGDDGVMYELGSTTPYTGIAIRLYLSGEKEATLNYRNGVMNGEAVFYDKKGDVTMRGTYFDGEHDGLWQYFKDGITIRTANYEAGRLAGEFTEYFDNGKISLKKLYKDGKIWEYYKYSAPDQISDVQIFDRANYIIEYSKYDNQKLKYKLTVNLRKQNGSWQKFTDMETVSSKGNIYITLSDNTKFWNIQAESGKIATLSTTDYSMYIAN